MVDFNELVGCYLIGAEVDFATHTTTLYVVPGNCTGMTGAIQYAQRCDPGVVHIKTISGIVSDMQYVRDDVAGYQHPNCNGAWRALHPPAGSRHRFDQPGFPQ